MKQGTFEPCDEHQGHFNGCLWCELKQTKEELKLCREISESRRENILALEERVSELYGYDPRQKSSITIEDLPL